MTFLLSINGELPSETSLISLKDNFGLTSDQVRQLVDSGDELTLADGRRITIDIALDKRG
jgi:hypothetical protein